MTTLLPSQKPPPEKPPSLVAELRQLPASYWALFAGIFINRCGTFVYPFLTIVLTRRHFADWEIGLALGGYGIGGLLATLGGGWFADRFGRKNTIIVGAFSNSLFVLSMAWADALPLMLGLTVLTGLSVGFFGPAAGALVADVVPKHLQLRAFAGTRLAANAGFAAGTMLGGILVTQAPIWLFAGDAITTAVYGLVAIFLIPHGVRTSQENARWSEALAVIRKDRRFWQLFSAQVCISMVFAQFSSTYSKYILLHPPAFQFLGHVFSKEQIFGILVGWNGVLIVGLEMVLTRFTQKFNSTKVMTLGHLLVGLGFFGNLFAGSFGALLLCMTIFTIGEMLAMPMMSAMISDLAPHNMRGRYMGAMSLSWATANLLGPQVGFALLGWSTPALWIACGCFGLAAASIQWWGTARLTKI